jgi:hypothetical protein
MRMMHVVNLTKALYVLHAFMKKSKSGIGLPKPDAELIAVRRRRAREIDKEDCVRALLAAQRFGMGQLLGPRSAQFTSTPILPTDGA